MRLPYALATTPLLVLILAHRADAADAVIVTSPDATIQTEVTATGGILRYRVSVDGKEIVQPSEIDLTTNQVHVGQQVALGEPTRRTVDDRYRLFGGKSEARNHAHEASIPLTAAGEAATLEVHVADSGVAVRLRLPAKAGRKIDADGTTWRLAGDPTVWAAYRANACYENMLFRSPLSALTADKTLDLPVTAQVGGVWVSLTEAVLRDYSDFGVATAADHALAGRLVAAAGWTTDAAVDQPWRVTMIARDLTALVNTTLVQDLNPPPRADLVDAAWIRPGRATWQWMAAGAPKYAEQHQWVDWTKQLGYEYYLVDDGWKKWKDGTNDDWACLKATTAYAASQGVKVWLWVHSNEVKDPASRAAYFDKAVAAGVVGVKIDFMPSTSAWWSTWYYDTARDAADRKLLVDFHGATKPTGMERTWPNELSREGIRGHEWQMTAYKRILDPAHDTILPFTRYLAGHGDYTPTVFAAKVLQGNTWAHELAQAIVFTSPFLCFGGHPRDYVANPAFDVLQAIPATWDETRVLPGTDPGRTAILARRHGTTWFVGSLTGPEAVPLDASLEFLGAGTWQAVILGEDPASDAAWRRTERTVTATDRISLPQRAKSGAVVWLRPATK